MNTQQELELAQKLAKLLDQNTQQVDQGTAAKLLAARKEALAHYQDKPAHVWLPQWATAGTGGWFAPFGYNLRTGMVLAALLVVGAGFRTVQQGNVAVTTLFGKYRRVLRPGLNVIIPLFEKVYRRITVQNRAVELQFQAITQDQANVYFTAMMVYGAINEQEETIKNIAFKFVSEKDFLTALVRSVEGSTRGFVATKRQAEILGLRGEIVSEVKENLDHVIETWGYHLIDLQLNDITFDQAITTSMAQVVASNNLKAAATNEGDALLIRKTKEAEALGDKLGEARELTEVEVALFDQWVQAFLEEWQQHLPAAPAPTPRGRSGRHSACR